jgi:hypothetical protein
MNLYQLSFQLKVADNVADKDTAFFHGMKKALRPFMRCFKVGFCLSLLSLLMFSQPTAVLHAASITAASPSFQDVSNAVARAANGDTVFVPVGTATWNSTLNLTKAIYLIGAGTNSTIISNNVGTLINWHPGTDLPIRLSGICFNSTDNHARVVAINGKCTAIRVDHCWFNKSDQTLMFNPYGNSVANGPAYGVVDHCVFRNCSRAYFPCNSEPGTDGGIWGATSWSRPVLPGTTNTIVFEDCFFGFDSGFGSKVSDTTMIYGGYGGRVCIRYCTFAGGAGGYIDAHGDNPDYSVVFYEIYNNTFTSGAYGAGGAAFANQRGGMSIYHDNVFNGGRGQVQELIKYWPTDVHTVTNTYWWNNTWNGSTNQASMILVKDVDATCSGCSTATIHQDKQYFLHAPQPKQTFYPYTPLVYPHPLVSGQGGDPTTNPVIFLSSGTLDYGLMAVDSTSNQIFTVKNAGMGTLTGAVSGVSSPFSIVSGGSYSLGSGQTQDVVVGFAPTQTGSYSQMVTFTGGGDANATVRGMAWTVLPGLSFNPSAGLISSPFLTNLDGSISQSVETADPTQGGKAVYPFSIVNASNYVVAADVNAPADNANSFFVNIDAEPTLAMIWDIPVTSGWTNKQVTWRGAGIPPKVSWVLGAGTHQLIIRGREAGVSFGQIYILTSPPTPSVPTVVTNN